MSTEEKVKDQIRPMNFQRNFLKHPEGSVLVTAGDTKVICTASVEEEVPGFLKGTGQGWVTAEYALLPRSTDVRTQRESTRGRASGRTYEIQRLIGRSLRSVVCLSELGERTIYIDCDVIQADGGTRTASISGSYVALLDALFCLKRKEAIQVLPVKDFLGAVSVGIVEGEHLLDLNFQEDYTASVDLNVVMTGSEEFVEIQGTAEGETFSRQELDSLLALAQKGIKEIIATQKESFGPDAAEIEEAIEQNLNFEK